MAAINDLIEQIADEGLRARIREEMVRLKGKNKFGLVYENHEPECAMLPDVKIRRGSTVARKEGKLEQLFVVKAIEGGDAVCLVLGAEEGKEERIALDSLVAVAEFGEPIYPYLKPLDRVENAPNSDLWHTLIEADNFHALQLLAYLYAGKVDCIYIDPPYNTGARDWKYNNDYVDSSDQYRHSKWLSMMEKRLKLAKKLLNPADSVLIVTIDEKEYLHLGCLLEQMFPEARIQMVSTLVNPKGVTRNGFRRADEYIFVIMLGDAVPCLLDLGIEWSPSAIKSKVSGSNSKSEPDWTSMMRRGSHSSRRERLGLYYAIYVNPNTKQIEKIGNPLPQEVDKDIDYAGLVQVLPLRTNGSQGCWQLSPQELKNRKSQGRIRVGNVSSYGYVINYLPNGEYNKIISGEFDIIGKSDNNDSIIAKKKEIAGESLSIAPTQWKIASHDSSAYGSTLIRAFFNDKRFEFPKSLYAVHDALRFFVANKPNALIVDFFAGSGTTLHAVNLLNKEDGGKRRCIMVTNNEVSEDEAIALKAKGYKPGDEEWERLGIARYVNWPRTQCSIKGVDVNGKAIVGDYITTQTEEKRTARQIKQLEFDIPQGRDGKKVKKQIVMLLGKKKLAQTLVTDDCPYIVSEDYPVSILFEDSAATEWLDELEGQDHIKEIYVVTNNSKLFKQVKNEIAELLGDYVESVPVTFPMADGFAANAEFFKLGFLDKTSVALGRQFRELLPILWMKAGAHGERPTIAGGEEIPPMLVLEQNHMAILTNEAWMDDFAMEVKNRERIESAYIVTDSKPTFLEISHLLPGISCYQLYTDYLDNFRINCTRQ